MLGRIGPRIYESADQICQNNSNPYFCRLNELFPIWKQLGGIPSVVDIYFYVTALTYHALMEIYTTNEYKSKSSLAETQSWGYGWGIAHVCTVIESKGVLNFYLITHNAKVIFCVENGEAYRLMSPNLEDLTAKLSVNQFINRFRIDPTGNMNIVFRPITTASIRQTLPNTVYQKYKHYPFQNSTQFYQKLSPISNFKSGA